MKTYKIIRFYHPNEMKENCIIKTGLTLEEAQTHCISDISQEIGVFFDGYTAEQSEEENES